MHTCCGVCASHCIEVVRAEGWEPVLFYSNHNIFPHAEWVRRRDAAKALAAAYHVAFVEDTPNHTQWQAQVGKGFEACPEGGARCARCFAFSLQRAYEAMERLHCQAFTTTLSVSPHKKSALLHTIGEQIGGKRFIPYDFKKKEGYLDSTRRAKALGLYRQVYCGCEYSMRHREAYRVVILGLGYRGRIYAAWALAHPEALKVVAIAEPDETLRQQWQARLGLAEESVYASWEEAVEAVDAECVIVALPDHLHFAAATAAIQRNRHLLLEKPIATTWEACVQLHTLIHQHPVLVQVGHILRFTPYYRKIYELIRSGTLGELVSIRHLEPVGYWKAALAFCRGTWGNTAQSTPMILQKCSHDFDLFAWWIGTRCMAVQSFGGLQHFRPAYAPPGAAAYCKDCPQSIERTCAYSARRLICEYSDAWYMFPAKTPEAREQLLSGDIGRCVYACDNDAVDHQVVNLLFEGGVTVSHAMEAYTLDRDRETRLFFTRGEIIGNARTLRIRYFDARREELWDAGLESGIPAQESSYTLGNDGLLQAWVEDLRSLPPAQYEASFQESIASHAMAFAAEESRLRHHGAPIPLATL